MSGHMETTDTWNTSMKWSKMNFGTKMIFLGKLVVALCTFGFVFPNVMD
jgi:hypothetical protein